MSGDYNSVDPYSPAVSPRGDGVRRLQQRFGGQAEQLTSGLTGGFGRLIDKVEPYLDKAPADLQPAARKAVQVARERPLLTMAGLAIGALLLSRGSKR